MDYKRRLCILSSQKAVSSASVLQTFDPRRKTVLNTDDSKYAIGTVLEQLKELGPRPVAFDTQTLQPAEQTYAAHERELLAVLDTIIAWRPYIHGTNIFVHTDHYPLKYLQPYYHL